MRAAPILRSGLGCFFLGTGIAGFAGGCGEDNAAPPAAPPATQPTTQPHRPTTAPSTVPAEAPAPAPQTYLDVYRTTHPDFPTTRPLGFSLPIDEAATLLIENTVLLDRLGYLWIVHEEGQTPEELAGRPLDGQSFVVDRPIAFTWWKRGREGKSVAEIIYQLDDGRYRWLHETGSADFDPPPQPLDWERAFVLGPQLIVPTRGGAAVLQAVDRPDPETFYRRYGRRPPERRPDANGRVEAEFLDLLTNVPGAAQPGDEDLPRTQIRLDGEGLLAWIAWEGPRRPGGGMARFSGGEWTRLEGRPWSDRPVLLVPLTDGSVLQLAVDESGDSELTAVPLRTRPVDAAAIESLVEQLSAGDFETREEAFASLQTSGPGAWEIIERLMADEPPVIRKQLELLLGDRDRPSFGGLAPEPGPVEVRQWLADGGVILKFDAGILMPDDMGITLLERPAWLLIRPGRRISLLDRMLAAELASDPDAKVHVWGDEWVVTQPGEGARRWLINHFQTLLKQEHAEWQEFVGIDQAGRWLFRQSERPGATMLVDVRVPDPTPRLPTWVLETGAEGIGGWDENDWPVTELGGAWRLAETGWEPLAEDAEVHNDRVRPEGDWLVKKEDGTIYRGGVEKLIVERPDGSRVNWDLPPEILGSGEALAVVDEAGRVFLFNRPGRVAQIAPTPDGPEPFELEAVFDEDLPGAVPRRVWIDPIGRICAAYFGDAVAVMWPDGRVPAEIRKMMPGKREEGAGPANPMEGI